MHILMLAEASSVHTQRWAGGLRSRGHRISLLSLGAGAIDGVEVLPLQVPGWGWKYPGRWEQRYVQYLGELIEAVGPDLIHVHYLRDYPLVEAAGPIPILVSTWGSDVVRDEFSLPETAGQRQSKVRLLEKATAVTATNRFLASQTAIYGNMPVADIRVIPFGVALNQFAPKGVDADRIQSGYRRVGFLKHLEPRYGIEHFIRCAAAIKGALRNVDFVVAGDGTQEAAMKSLAAEVGIADQVAWLGDIPHDRVADLLRSLDVLVMPSLAEAFGVSAIESQAVGTPVVCYDIPGVHEAVHAGVGGIRVPKGDVDALAKMTLRLLVQREERERLGARGRAFVERQFDFSRNVGSMIDLYEHVTTGRSVVSPG